MKILLNGRVIPAERPCVSAFDHGFLYGDGVYETVRTYGYRVFHWPDHDRRLRQSCRAVALACPWSSAALERMVRRIARENRKPDATVRITLSRGPGPLGLDPALCPKPTLALLLHPDRRVEALRGAGASVGIPRIRRNHPRCLDPQIKSNNSLNTIFAKMEAKRLKVFEAVLLNLDGFLTEGTTSNLFFARRGILYTPALACGLLSGVTRRAVMTLARRAKIAVREGRYAPADLRRADEAFLCSTTLEIMPITRVVEYRGARGMGTRRTMIGNGRPGLLTQRLHAALRGSIRAERRGLL